MQPTPLGNYELHVFQLNIPRLVHWEIQRLYAEGGDEKSAARFMFTTLIANFVEILLNFIKFDIDIERETSLFLIMYIEFKLHFINIDFLRIKIISVAK